MAGGPPLSLLFAITIDLLHKILDLATQKGLLHKIRGQVLMVRTSLYANDGEVFMAPIRRDIDNLASNLRYFGEVMGLCTNLHKSSVVPI